MPSEVLAKLEKLIHGQKPVPAEDINDNVDATALGELLSDTYQHTGSSKREIADRLLKTIQAQEYPGASQSESNTTIRSFAAFLDRRMNRLKDIFSRIDRDEDRRITLSDVYEYLDQHKLIYDPEKVQLVYNIIDKDHDGSVTYEEFVHQLLLVPSYGRKPNERFFYRAYDFFVEDLGISADSDVVMSKELNNGMGYFYAGGIAGVISRTCTAPFDRVKVYLIANSTRHSPLTFREAIASIYSSGNPPGLRAFFTGNGLNTIKVLPESAMKFGGFEFAKKMLAEIEGVDDPANLSRTATFFAGGIGGMVSQFFVYPIDTLKFRVQCAAQSGGTRGANVLFPVLRNMIKEGGIRSFYRGLYVGVLGIFPFAAMDLGIFSALKAAYIRSEAKRLRISETDVQMGNLAVLSMGAISGSLGASVVYPVNLIRTRIQTQGTAAHPFHYKNFVDCYHQSLKREGWRGLFRGLGPNLAKVAPSVSISYLVYEKSKSLMNLA